MTLKREEPRTRSEYTYRRTLTAGEMLPAIGVGLGVGALVFYVTYLLLQRTPLDPGTLPARASDGRLRRGSD